MFNPEAEANAPVVVRTMIETCYQADGLLWSSPMYNGSVSGSFKNAIDWLHVAERFARDPALHRSAECERAAERVAQVG